MNPLILLADFFTALQIFVASGLAADELKHGLVSLLFAIIFYYKTKSLKYSAIVILTTYIIDADHLVDYFLYYGTDFSFSRFIRLENFALTKRAIVPLHAWEWLIFLSIIAYTRENKNLKLLLSAISVGVLSHLIWDMLTVNSFWFYSILYRISKNFTVIT